MAQKENEEWEGHKAIWIDVVNSMTKAGVRNWNTEAKDIDG
jgi:L-rhamnose mutarotase